MESECFTVSIQDPKGTETKVRIILELEATSLLLAKDREVTFLLSSEEKVNLLLYPGISGGEVAEAIRSAFGLEHQVAGLVNPFLDIYFPITLFSIAPKYFSKRAPYRIVSEQGRGQGLDVRRVDGRVEDIMVVPNVSLAQLAALRKNLAALPGDTLDHEAFCEIVSDSFGEVPQVLKWFEELFTTHETNDDGLVCIAGLLSELPASDDDDRRILEEDRNVKGDSHATGLAGSLEGMVQYIIWAGSTVQSAPDTPRKLVGPLNSDNQRTLLDCTLAKLRNGMGIEAYPGEEVLGVLCSAAASDGKLTRAEFDSCLKELADMQGLPPLSTANDIFGLFDGTKGGILHFRDLAAGLAVLCDGCMALSVLRACRLYKGADGGMGCAEISAFTTSIFKVLYAASSEDWDRLALIPRELAAVVSSEYLVRRGLPLSGREGFDSSSDWFVPASSEDIDRTADARNGRDWVHPLEILRKHDMRDVLELLSALVDKHGGVSLPAFNGCMRALVEVGGRSIMTDTDAAKLKVSLRKLYTILEGGGQGAVPFKDLASGVSTFCGSDKDSKIRALFDIHGDEEGLISEEDTKRFFTAVFKVLFEVDSGALRLAGFGSSGEEMDPTHLADNTAAHAFEDAAVNPDGSMSVDEFRSWYLSSAGLTSAVTPAGESTLHLESDGSSIALDVEEVHRIFKLGDIHVAGFVDGLSATTDNGRVSSDAFLRYMCDLADVRSLRVGTREAVSVAGRIFNLFDEKKQQEVELRVLASGLSMLCKGSWKDRVACLFSLLDTENRGSLTREDMQIYCFATFKLLCASEAIIGGAAGPNTRANMAVAEAFRSEPDEKGREPERLDRHMFCGLYPEVCGRREGYLVGGSWDSRVELLLSTQLDQARQCTQLCGTSFARALGTCKEVVSDGGSLTRLAVHKCFRRIRATMDTPAQQYEARGLELDEEGGDGVAAAERVMDGLFDALDVCQTGTVGFSEFASGLSTLCGGARDEKMSTVFDMFRGKEGGSVLVNDVRTYLTSAFRVLFKLKPGLEEHCGISPEGLGSVISMNALEAVDLGEDGRISPEDFGSWFADGTNPTGRGVLAAKRFGLGLATLVRPDIEHPGENTQQLRGDVEQPRAPALWGDQLKRHGHSMMRARKLLCLDCFNITDLMEMLAEVEVAGSVSLDDFWRCIGYVLQLGGTEEGGAEWDEASLLTERIHRTFQDGDNMADFAAITSGISILCSSSVEEKILVALFLFDTDADGKLTFTEVTMYIASVLRVMHAVSEGVSAISDPDELGASLATQCFSQAQLSIDAKLGIDDFRLFLG